MVRAVTLHICPMHTVPSHLKEHQAVARRGYRTSQVAVEGAEKKLEGKLSRGSSLGSEASWLHLLGPFIPNMGTCLPWAQDLIPPLCCAAFLGAPAAFKDRALQTALSQPQVRMEGDPTAPPGGRVWTLPPPGPPDALDGPALQARHQEEHFGFMRAEKSFQIEIGFST